MKDKKPESGPKLKRDEHNKLVDRDDNQRITNELVRKLITEERKHDKEKSFHRVRTGRRDVVVMMGVYIRNSVDGNVVVGEDETQGFERFSDRDMYKYKTFDMVTVEYPARNLPGSNEFIGKGLLSAFRVLCKWLMSIGALKG